MEIRDSAMDPASNLVGSYELVFDDGQAFGGTLRSVTVLSGGAYDAATGSWRWPCRAAPSPSPSAGWATPTG